MRKADVETAVRFVVDGEGIFDVRDSSDQWVRIEVDAGDLIIIPAGTFHRFLMTDQQFIRCQRLFADHSGWNPDYRAAATVEQGEQA